MHSSEALDFGEAEATRLQGRVLETVNFQKMRNGRVDREGKRWQSQFFEHGEMNTNGKPVGLFQHRDHIRRRGQALLGKAARASKTWGEGEWRAPVDLVEGLSEDRRGESACEPIRGRLGITVTGVHGELGFDRVSLEPG
ncbi:hypothetical protein G7054_g1468 [Neopestalotiopsis clavispora]|nr:hypothetical protein G7054_g1468 [Neopestalotiopsis clavispora]